MREVFFLCLRVIKDSSLSFFLGRRSKHLKVIFILWSFPKLASSLTSASVFTNMSETALKLTIMLHSTPDNEILLASFHHWHFLGRTCYIHCNPPPQAEDVLRDYKERKENSFQEGEVEEQFQPGGGGRLGDQDQRGKWWRRDKTSKEKEVDWNGGGRKRSSGALGFFLCPVCLVSHLVPRWFLHLWQVFDNVFIILILTVKSQVSF